MPRHFYNDPGHAHFLTYSCFHKRQLLTSDRVHSWLSKSIDTARIKHDFSLWAYVFMPDHVHLLIHPNHDEYSVSKILRDIKEPVSQKLMSHLRKTAPWELEKLRAHQGIREVHRLWQAGGGFDRNLADWDEIAKKIGYIESNPVRRKYVKNPADWIWSSARARLGEERVPLRVDALIVSASGKQGELSKP